MFLLLLFLFPPAFFVSPARVFVVSSKRGGKGGTMRPRFVFSISPRLGLRNLFSSFFFLSFETIYLTYLSTTVGVGRVI